MSSIKVSALTAKTSPAGTEELLINDSGVSKKITIANLPDTNTTYSVGDGGLTQVNFTTADNSKLDAIEAGATADQTAGEIEAIVTHDNLLGFVANEHIDWTTDQGTTNLHAGNYTDTNTTYTSSDFTHNSLSGVTANEHIDWTTDQGATNVHAGNYTDTDTVYTHPTGAGNEHLPSSVSQTEAEYLDGVTSDIQTQFSTKRFLPTAKSANYTAVDGDSIIVTAGSITITLPSSPTAGDTVIVKDGTGAAATTNWTVARNSSNIASSATDLTFDKNWTEITMTYVDATIGWSV